MAVFVRKILEGKVIIALVFICLAAAFYFQKVPHFGPDDFKILYTLFIFMVIIKGLEINGLFKIVESHLKNSRNLSFDMILATYFSGVIIYK